MFSKIERGERGAKRQQVILLAELLHTPQNELLSVWLADKVYELIKDEPTAIEALDLTIYKLKTKEK